MTPEEAKAIKASRQCFCGALKKAPNAFCVVCYGHLRPLERRALWSDIGKGFEAAYLIAVARMRKAGTKPIALKVEDIPDAFDQRVLRLSALKPPITMMKDGKKKIRKKLPQLAPPPCEEKREHRGSWTRKF